MRVPRETPRGAQKGPRDLRDRRDLRGPRAAQHMSCQKIRLTRAISAQVRPTPTRVRPRPRWGHSSLYQRARRRATWRQLRHLHQRRRPSTSHRICASSQLQTSRLGRGSSCIRTWWMRRARSSGVSRSSSRREHTARRRASWSARSWRWTARRTCSRASTGTRRGVSRDFWARHARKPRRRTSSGSWTRCRRTSWPSRTRSERRQPRLGSISARGTGPTWRQATTSAWR